jgi:ethanolamine ammonia-lyase small subunit
MNELKKHSNPSFIQQDNWQFLQSFTTARIALGSTGTALPLEAVLDFKLAHAQAREAVYSVLDEATLAEEVKRLGLPVHFLDSKAENRPQYLQRPDLGRQLNEFSKKHLQEMTYPFADVAIMLVDGLSATAINHHAIPLLECLLPLLQKRGFSTAPISIVRQGRVAIGDEVGFLLKATFSVLLIGERPGLSSPNSMGAYLTYHPKVGLTDESRNCVSNIRHEGLSYQSAAEKIFYLIQESFRLQYSGVHLKDEL